MGPVLTADEVGRIILYVAPGFFAYAAYAWRMPGGKPGQLELLILSVAMSLPLVAIVGWMADRTDVAQNPLSVRYVLLLVGFSLLVGYLAGEARSRRWTREVLLKVGFPYEPDAVLTATLQRLPVPTLVTVLFKDGRRLTGQPVKGTNDPSLTTQQMYLSHCRWWDDEKGDWEDVDEAVPVGVLANLNEVLTISTIE